MFPGYILDQVLFAVDQGSPVKLRFAYGDMVDGGPLNFMQGLPGGYQYFLRRAAAVRAGATKIVRLDHGDRHFRRA